MANDVVLGAAMRSNLLSLQNTQRNIDSTQLRLATGKKVNSALDNPQSFFQANSLNNRASDLTRLLDGIGQSIRTIEAADKGITALTKLVEQASSVAEEAQSELRGAAGLATITGTKDLRGINLTTQSAGAIAANDQFTITLQDKDVNNGTAISATVTIAANQTVYDIAAQINGTTANDFNKNVRASVTTSGQLKIESLEDGAALRIVGTSANPVDSAGFAFLGLDATAKTETAGAAGTLRNGGTAIAGRTLVSAEIPEAQKDTTTNKYLASTNLEDAGFLAAAGDTVTLRMNIDGTETSMGTFTGASTIQDVIDGINNSDAYQKVSASLNVNTGRLELKFSDKVGTAALSFESGAAGTDVGFGFGTGASDGVVANAAFSGESFRFSGSSANLEQYTKDYNKLREQIDGIVKDANYRGVNLLGGDSLTSFFNEDRSNTLVTEGQDLTVLGMGVEKADFTDAASIEKSLSEIRGALETVRAFGTSIANDLSIIQTRRDFTEQTINTLKAGAADLTDADLNEEGANLLALQTAQQLGVTSLSLASQSQQSVLRLF